MKVVAFAGGVGGAKMVDGLARILPPEDLSIIVNTGDDFNFFGLKICPDIDTVCYTLAGLANPITGWGRMNETWNTLESITRLGGPNWFQLGDRDLGTHLERTRLQNEGRSLSQITEKFCNAWGIIPKILPMSDDPIPTIVHSDSGSLSFQEYFVKEQCQPEVRGFFFMGVENSKPAPGVIPAIRNADLIVICPSNPWVSIDPILAVPGVRDAFPKLTRKREKKEIEAVVVGISPIIGGSAVKGPAAKMYSELGIKPSALAVAQHYADLLDGFVFDKVDTGLSFDIERLDIRPLVTNTLMKTIEDRKKLALDIISFGNQILFEN